MVECNIPALGLDNIIAQLEDAIPFSQDLEELTILVQFFALVK